MTPGRTLNLLTRTRRCMTTLQLLAALRAEGPVSKSTVRQELNALLASGTVTRVAGVYYVLTSDLTRAHKAHLGEVHAYLTRHGSCGRKVVIDALGISAVFLNWVLHSKAQRRVSIVINGARNVLVPRPPQPARGQRSGRPMPGAQEDLLTRVLTGIRSAKERKDSVTNLVTRLGLTKDALLACAQTLARRGLIAIQQGLLTVLVFLRDPAPLPTLAPAPVAPSSPAPPSAGASGAAAAHPPSGTPGARAACAGSGSPPARSGGCPLAWVGRTGLPQAGPGLGGHL